MTKAVLRREGNTIVPVGAESLAVLHGFKDGAEFMGNLHGARNIKQLNLFWTLVGLVADSTDRPKEVVKRSIAIRLGFFTIEVDMDGNERVVADSIAVESMTQAVFNDFFQNAINLIAEWLGSSPKDVRSRFEELIAEKRYEGMRRG